MAAIRSKSGRSDRNSGPTSASIRGPGRTDRFAPRYLAPRPRATGPHPGQGPSRLLDAQRQRRGCRFRCQRQPLGRPRASGSREDGEPRASWGAPPSPRPGQGRARPGAHGESGSGPPRWGSPRSVGSRDVERAHAARSPPRPPAPASDKRGPRTWRRGRATAGLEPGRRDRPPKRSRASMCGRRSSGGRARGRRAGTDRRRPP